jgi:hydroxymethylpyrimidine pyrophosphatase-like HAD family hydrolase
LGNFRLIALDLDGTVLNSRKEVTPRTRDALQAARERGIVTVVATGRTPHSALRWSREIGGGPVICCNGGGILDESGAFLIQRGVPRAPLLHLLKVAQEARVMAECYTAEGIRLDRPFEQARAYLRWVRPGMSLPAALVGLFRLWRLNRIGSVRSLVKWAERPDLPAVLKVMAVGRRAELDGFALRMNRELPSLEVTTSGPDNLEITAAGVTKGSALQQLASRLQIPREAVLAVGDSENDLQMLRYAGLGIAMGSAPDEVKAAAGRVTASCDQEGVAQIIEEMCL